MKPTLPDALTNRLIYVEAAVSTQYPGCLLINIIPGSRPKRRVRSRKPDCVGNIKGAGSGRHAVGARRWLGVSYITEVPWGQ